MRDSAGDWKKRWQRAQKRALLKVLVKDPKMTLASLDRVISSALGKSNSGTLTVGDLIESGGKPDAGPIFDLAGALELLRERGQLKPEEMQVVERVLWGDSDAEIAAHLGRTLRMTKFLVSAILRKTGARSRTGLIRLLLEPQTPADPLPSQPRSRRADRPLPVD